MNNVRFTLILLIILCGCNDSLSPVQCPRVSSKSHGHPNEAIPKYLLYEGEWVTTSKRKLKGNLRCDIEYLGEYHWVGTFSGNWRIIRFSYYEKWAGRPLNLKGKAVINNILYYWTGKINKNKFVGEFRSEKYVGYFELHRRNSK